jgi:hypothetical protein
MVSISHREQQQQHAFAGRCELKTFDRKVAAVAGRSCYSKKPGASFLKKIFIFTSVSRRNSIHGGLAGIRSG